MEFEQISALVVSEDKATRQQLEALSKPYFALLETTNNYDLARILYRRYHFDVLIVELNTIESLTWIDEIREYDAYVYVIAITSCTDTHFLLRLFNTQVSHCLVKPLDNQELLSILTSCISKHAQQRDYFHSQKMIESSHDFFEGMICYSEALKRLCGTVQRIAPTASTVLLTGETGTGKECLASALHQQSGRQGEFVPLNCGSVSPELLESELFGHIKGAFTTAHHTREGLFRYAHQGTLFLDEIAEMSLAMQAKLLRVLESRKIRSIGTNQEIQVDVRIIAATNHDLPLRVKQGLFREDLFYRLNVVHLSIPPLRERPDDIIPLAKHFSETLAVQLGVPPIPFNYEDNNMLVQQSWQGNVRELRNIIERSLLLGECPSKLLQTPPTVLHNIESSTQGYSEEWRLDEVEKHHILKVLEACNDNKSEAARRLGISRKTLERRLHTWQQMSAL